jgi:hypothetical protein
MQTKFTALRRAVTSDRLKITLSLLAVLFFAVEAWQTKSIGNLGWTILCVLWTWPEPKPKEEKK